MPQAYFWRSRCKMGRFVRSNLSLAASIGTAKDFLRENADNGCYCPVCQQTVKFWPRSLNSTMALSLIAAVRLVRTSDNSIVSSRDIVRYMEAWYKAHIDGDFAKLRFWGFIEEIENEDPSKRTSGLWLVQPLAKKFIADTSMRVLKTFFMYNQKLVAWDTETSTNIVEALGNHFDYSALLEG